MTVVKLKAGREKSLRHRHPWVYSGAIEGVEGEVAPGAVVAVTGADGQFLARGYYNPQSRIGVRVLSWDESEQIDSDWWRRRVRESIDSRSTLLEEGVTNACRLAYSEADGLPGLIVDRYNDVVVVQMLTAGVEAARDVILDAIEEAARPAAIFDRSDASSRQREGLAATSGVVRGDTERTEADILENGGAFTVKFGSGQKTGFYLDQRVNRQRVAQYARGRNVLDVFAYTGAFSVCALGQGAASVAITDSSEAALVVAEQHVERNAPGAENVEILQADAFELLRGWAAEERRFDMVILDPPKFASNRHQVEKALRAYKDANMLAMKLLTPGGILATFSCSSAVSASDFTLAVSWAGIDARRDVRLLERLSQGADHPVLASFPESEYLKGMVCQIR
jgi:23S rRNA (cytosine1962-C5)-methyltransferase